MNIELKQSELAQQGFTPQDFRNLQLAEQRWIAARIYRAHADPEDRFRAEMMDLAHPNFSQFSVLIGQ